ncbi:helix-turn-helix domain-containing protein [Streptomyces sp. NPDC017964]|uniref:helix-turn-helix domain-containing protein n=1 Tax=Streptomyces sp. NPDC017964 TaxID=3365022 RepID=UPI00379A2836
MQAALRAAYRCTSGDHVNRLPEQCPPPLIRTTSAAHPDGVQRKPGKAHAQRARQEQQHGRHIHHRCGPLSRAPRTQQTPGQEPHLRSCPAPAHTAGTGQTTVDEITEAADVARGTFFNHFQRKEDPIAE